MYGCVCCGERWFAETRREWLDRIGKEARATVPEIVKKGRPSRADTVLALLEGKAMTTAEIAAEIGIMENMVTGTLWALERLGRLVRASGVAGHIWSVPLAEELKAS